MKDTTLLIQGKIYKTTKTYVERYLNQCDDIVVSCWDTDNIDEIKTIPNITIIKNPIPDLNLVKIWQPDQSANYYYQIFSTWKGLENIKTKYTIKLRSDEYYNDLSSIFEKLKLDDSVIVTSNIITTPPIVSDHIFMGKTKTLLKCFKIMGEELNSINKPKNVIIEPRISIEKVFTHIFKKEGNIVFVNYTDLGEYIIVANHMNLRYTTGQLLPPHLTGFIE